MLLEAVGNFIAFLRLDDDLLLLFVLFFAEKTIYRKGLLTTSFETVLFVILVLLDLHVSPLGCVGVLMKYLFIVLYLFLHHV